MDIKKAIGCYGHSISSLARLMGITPSALSQQINNKSITLLKVEKIAELCGTDLESFISAGKGSVKCKAVCPHCGGNIEIEIKVK